MEDLLPYFERELTFLRRNAREFAQRYPKVAARLSMVGDTVEDPHVERLLEAFALLASRVHKKLDDDFPQISESLLDVLYPHYLRPFPSCSIARFDAGAVGQLSTGVVVSRGTLLSSRPARGVACRFRTAYDVRIAPLRLVSARYRAGVAPPTGVVRAHDGNAWISLGFELTSAQAGIADIGSDALRVFLDGEPSLAAAIRDVLLARVHAVFAGCEGRMLYVALDGKLPQAAGFGDNETLIDFDARSHQAYRLLTEYFAFPDKFNFIDLPLPSAAELVPGTRRFELHFTLRGIRHDSDESRLLERLGADNFLLGCTPVVNLFRMRADPIRVTHTRTRYPLVADCRSAHAYEISSVDSVRRLRQTAQGESVDEFRPFYSMHHGDVRPTGRYWIAHRDESVRAHSPGHEMELSIVDADFDPAAAQTDTLSVEVTCTNRDLPSQLPFGLADGDLFVEGGSVARTITMLRRPTPSLRFERARGALWRLISHLSLNHLSLAGTGVHALKETLRLYDLPRSTINASQIDGIVSLESRAASMWLPGQPFPAMVRGVEIRLIVEEDNFVGSGIHLFAWMLSEFFGMYVHANSFTRLTVVAKKTGTEIVRCPPHAGAAILA